MVISYSVDNDKRFRNAVRDATRKVSDLRFAFKEIARDWRKSNQAQFTLKGSGLYPPLNPDYAERKRRIYGNQPIMVASGELKKSLTRTGGDNISLVKKDSLTFGTANDYAVYHQSDRPRKKLPQRKVLFIGPEAPSTAPSEITGRLERFTAILEQEVKRQLGSAL